MSMTNHRDPICDTLIIGGGPAGLTAAIYLGRFRRQCVVVDDGSSRARWIPTSHNIPGFASGVGGEELLGLLKQQALKYGASILATRAESLSLRDRVFELKTDRRHLRSRFVILATGTKDHLPAMEGCSEATLRSLLRFCPICDAFEAIGKRIAVLSNGPLGNREADFLRHYSDRITVLHIGNPSHPPTGRAPDDPECLLIQLSDVTIRANDIRVMTEAGERTFDVMYVALGCSARHELARSVGAKRDDQGALLVNPHQETTVPGLYAAGDVVRGLNQVIVAAAESAIAATDIHNKLRAS